MATKQSGETVQDLAQISEDTVDASIARLAEMPMSEVVTISEGIHPQMGFPRGETNATKFLVGRLFTDAVFNQDIRAIQLIINRIDGGLPKDTELDNYQTMFGDCLKDVMAIKDGTQLKVMPQDTVMMAMCKALYATSVEDIYWDPVKKRKRKPTDAEKKERDAALRIVLERTGGRKTLSTKTEEKEQLGVASWIAQLEEPELV